jgi:RES domain-containing protein
VRVWRICRRRHARTPLTGRGGLACSGRWHFRGRLVVYTSEHLSLAALEVLVHVDPDLAPDDLVAVGIDVPEDLARETIEEAKLPRKWRGYPAPSVLQRLGSEWLDGGRTPLLEVPSALVPQERNLLINPAHPGARRIRVACRERFTLDPRFLEERRRR